MPMPFKTVASRLGFLALNFGIGLGQASATSVNVVGLFPGKAVVVIDGSVRDPFAQIVTRPVNTIASDTPQAPTDRARRPAGP